MIAPERSELRCCTQGTGQRGYANMQIVRAAAVALCAALAILSACATSVDIEPPAGVNLAGAWKLDPAASDDPQKVLADMRAHAYKIIERQQAAARAAAARSVDQQGYYDDSQATQVGPGGVRPDPLRRSPMAHVILDTIARGDFLTVRQGPGEFVLDYGASQRHFTPGARSVVSAEGGVGDQISGWKGRAYVIDVKAQNGPRVTDEYSLSGDGKQLLEKLSLGSGELPGVELKRVYRPTDEIAPRQAPNND
jgi:hypothetical protein